MLLPVYTASRSSAFSGLGFGCRARLSGAAGREGEKDYSTLLGRLSALFFFWRSRFLAYKTKKLPCTVLLAAMNSGFVLITQGFSAANISLPYRSARQQIPVLILSAVQGKGKE